MGVPKCSRCAHRRGIISENGFHYVCGLSWQAANNCIRGKKNRYGEIPKFIREVKFEDGK